MCILISLILMIPVLSIVGRSGSGKTTLLEKVIEKLDARGYRVGTIKHDVHGFDIDYEGKDSWRHRRAGSRTVVLSSKDNLAVIKDVDEEWSPDRLAFSFFSGVDIIITEGYKKSGYPKIEVIRKGRSLKPVCNRDPSLIAIASDIKGKGKLPRFDINDATGIADFIEERFLKDPSLSRGRLMVNGKEIPLKPFIETFIVESISGMVSSLKDCSNPKEIEIRIKR